MDLVELGLDPDHLITQLEHRLHEVARRGASAVTLQGYRQPSHTVV